MRKYLLLFLAVFILISCKSQPPAGEEPASALLIEEAAAEPAVEILEPEFDVVSIAILQADLVVTKFETVLRVKNPNPFAVDLSSITYELYGNGAFWAGGSDNNIFNVPASSSNEAKFTFEMNFVNMSRRLLDDIIALRQVNYRFKGQARVSPLVDGVSAFTADFDCTGLSDVRRN